MTISNHKGLIRNPEMGTTHACVFPNIWKPGQVGYTKFGMNVSNKMLLKACTVSELLRENRVNK